MKKLNKLYKCIMRWGWRLGGVLGLPLQS